MSSKLTENDKQRMILSFLHYFLYKETFTGKDLAFFRDFNKISSSNLDLIRFQFLDEILETLDNLSKFNSEYKAKIFLKKQPFYIKFFIEEAFWLYYYTTYFDHKFVYEAFEAVNTYYFSQVLNDYIKFLQQCLNSKISISKKVVLIEEKFIATSNDNT